jgi:hypothetical protein
MNDITISAGSYTVTIHSSSIIDKMKNKLFLITPATSLSGYETGAKETKIVNLLRITREININQGYIVGTSTKTAKQVKEDLIAIFNGGLASELVKLIYDGEEIEGFIEDLQVTEDARDLPSTLPEDVVRYAVQLNFVKGKLTSG